MITIDFETEAIDGNPIYKPPRGVGLAYLMDGHPPGYLHWVGEGGNTKWSIVADFLHDIWASDEAILCHNAPFDLSVAMKHFNLPMLPWNRIHDTMFLCYLADPYSHSLSLKPSAERYLDMPPEEQDLLTDWILANVPGSTRKNAGAHISKAPVELIAPYAIGDVVRTRALYDYLIDRVPSEPYNRERQLMPLLMESSRRGLRVATTPLAAALDRAQTALANADQTIRATLKAPNLELTKPVQVAAALESAGKLSHTVYTPTGRVATNKKALVETCNDPALISMLAYRSSLETCIGTFMIPWLAQAEADGRLHPEWNQVRSTENGRFGTRTGRISCARPNLMNVPTEFEQGIPPGFDPLPFMRQFLLPEEGHVWLKRDFSSQEIRIAAHFEDGVLLEAYIGNPNLDPHEMARVMIEAITGLQFARKHVKITGFQIIYGGGQRAIAGQVGCSENEAAVLKQSYFQAMPGIMQLSRQVNALGRSGQHITTWGGRKYFAEIGKDGRNFSYKLLNYLIQGSAADQTKQALIDWDSTQEGATFLATVHDEINISAPADNWEPHMQHLREMMNYPRLDCPMESEGFYGPNWHELLETT